MANQGFCSTAPRARFIERTEEIDRGGFLGAALRMAESKGYNVKERYGFDSAFYGESERILRNILPMDWEQLLNYYQQQGWIKLNKPASKKAGEDVFRIDKIDAQTSGMAAAVTKTYLESVGGGIKQAADNFIAKVNAGDDATQSGLFFASQMQHASRFGGFVLGWDQGYGRAVRMQGLRTRQPSVTRDADQFTAQAGEMQGFAEGSASIFKEIGQKLQDPATFTDGINELVALAKRVQFADTPLEVFRISSTAEVAGSAWKEVWINGMLSGPATIATNAVGFTWAMARPLATMIPAQMWASAGLPGADAARLAAVQSGASLTAMFQGFTDGLRLGWRAFQTERSVYAPLAGQTELVQGQAITSAAANQALESGGLFARATGWDRLPNEVADTIDTVGRFVRLPSRAMLASDEFVKHLAVRGEIAAQGIQAAAKSGVDLADKDALKAFINDEYKKAFNLDAPDVRDKYAVNRMYEYAYKVRDEANFATFQENNSWATGVNTVLGKFPFIRPMVPFVRTPLNILKQGFVESTGIGAMIKGGQIVLADPTRAVINIQDELAKDPRESFRIAGQIGMTTLLAGMVYGGVMSGAITGGGPARWSPGGRSSEQQKAWERAMTAAGRVPYSIQTPAGSVPFDRLGEPISIVLRMVADVAQYSGEMTGQEIDESMATIAMIAASGLYQATFLRGINDLMDVMTDRSEGGKQWGRLAQNYIATQTPFGSLLNYVDKVNDPYKRAYQGATFAEVMRVHEDTLGRGILAKFADRIPGLGTAPIQIDQITGSPVPVYPGAGSAGLNPLQMAVPFMPRGEAQADQTWARVYEVMGFYTEARPSGYKVTPKEQQELNKLMGTIRLNGLTFSEAFNRFYASGEVQNYVRNKNAAFADIRGKVHADFNRLKAAYWEAAEQQLASNRPSLMQRMALVESARRRQRENDFAGAKSDLDAMEQLFNLAKQMP